ncbi:hypothetical protein SAMN05444274_101109 [Mariniphaga anaerophila]|uniref:Uncharacterized protein n=1 Tax=Mariniphaga anaerophila TaxID=1484053 RepID=A0A1M4SQ99_9BACT|nr:hypothetical protein SAMN05444274_101109 [Mariniphaga anaerophila]
MRCKSINQISKNKSQITISNKTNVNFLISFDFLVFEFVLQQVNSVLVASFHHFIGPNARLYFANMGFAKEIHAQTRLPYSAADGQRQFAIQ